MLSCSSPAGHPICSHSSLVCIELKWINWMMSSADRPGRKFSCWRSERSVPTELRLQITRPITSRTRCGVSYWLNSRFFLSVWSEQRDRYLCGKSAGRGYTKSHGWNGRGAKWKKWSTSLIERWARTQTVLRCFESVHHHSWNRIVVIKCRRNELRRFCTLF